MSFIKKTWLARIGTGLNRFRMNNSTDVVLESNPISVTQQGDQLSADNMNNLETRIGNAFDEVENDFDKMAGNLAPIEVSPASTNHAVGTQIVYNGILYKVTSAISTGDNLLVGTNISPYPVSSAISDIKTPTTVTVGVNSAVVAGGDISYTKIGKLVVVDLSGVRVWNTGQDLILSTGLPKCLPYIYYGSYFFANRSQTYAGNVYMEEGTTNLCYHCFNTSPIYGSFVYIAQ